MRFVKGFAIFWWDFIVGDSIVLAIGVLALVGAGFLLTNVRDSGLVEILLPVGVILTLALSLPRRK